MRKITTLLPACAVMLATSCTIVQKTANSVDVSNTVHNYPVVADMTIGKKVTESSEWSNFPFKVSIPLEIGKGNLVSETVEKYGGDVLLEPQFIVEKTGYPFFRHYRVVVTGFIGNYKSFRNATDADLKALEATSGVYQNGTVRYNETSGMRFINK